MTVFSITLPFYFFDCYSVELYVPCHGPVSDGDCFFFVVNAYRIKNTTKLIFCQVSCANKHCTGRGEDCRIDCLSICQQWQ